MDSTLVEAREYLARVLPWPGENDPPAYVNVHRTHTMPGRDKPVWRGTACRSLDEAVRSVSYALSQPDVRDIYVCMSTQHRADERIGRNGKPFKIAVRAQENAAALKSFFVDIDVKADSNNGYATQSEAAKALGEFYKKIGLPRPSMVVASGGGLHVYWTLDRALTPDEWQPIADALAEATKANGLKCDTQCTVDSVRVLRIPDTFNRKQEIPRRVRIANGKGETLDYTVERIASALEPYKSRLPAKVVQFDLPLRPPLTEPSDLEAGIETRPSQPLNILPVVKECKFVEEALRANGKDLNNPLWNYTTLLSTFCDNGRTLAHKFAKGHPGYTQESTDELYDRKEREKEKGVGWPSCKAISAAGCVSCQGCPHFASGGSPLHLARKLPVPAPAPGGMAPPGPQAPLNDLPPGFKRNPDGIVLVGTQEPSGVTTYRPVFSYPMFDGRMRKTPKSILFTTTTKQGTQEIVLLLGDETVESGAFRKALQRQGVMIRDLEAKPTMDFIVAWAKQLQEIDKWEQTTTPFGWAEHGFVFANECWTANNEHHPAPIADPQLEAKYTPKGQISVWKDAARLITDQQRPTLSAVLASGFAGPLARFTDQEGIFLSIYSTKSGNGKSTAMKVAQAIWGHPKMAMLGLSDTDNRLFGILGKINSITGFWDEIKGEQMKTFGHTVFKLTDGRERGRMMANTKLAEQGSWQTLLVSATNASLVDAVNLYSGDTAAGYYRIFEYVVEPKVAGGPGRISTSGADRILGKLKQNYGVVGLEYAKFLGNNFDRVATEVLAFKEKFEHDHKIIEEERFWLATITAICMGARYGNELGFTEIDEEQLYGFMVKTLMGMRGDCSDATNSFDTPENVSNSLATFLTEHRAKRTVKTNFVTTGAGKPRKIDLAAFDHSRLEDVAVHYAVEDRLLRISQTALASWCVKARHQKSSFVDALKMQFGAKPVKVKLGAGTPYATAQLYALEIDLNSPNAIKYLQE